MTACEKYTDAVKPNGTALDPDKTIRLKKQCILEKLQATNIDIFKRYNAITKDTPTEIIQSIIRDYAIELAKRMFSEKSPEYKTINCSKKNKEAPMDKCARLNEKTMMLEKYLQDKLNRRLNPDEDYEDDNDDLLADDSDDILADDSDDALLNAQPTQTARPKYTMDYFWKAFSPTNTGAGAGAGAGGKKNRKLKSKKKIIIQGKRKTGKNRKLRTKLKK